MREEKWASPVVYFSVNLREQRVGMGRRREFMPIALKLQQKCHGVGLCRGCV